MAPLAFAEKGSLSAEHYAGTDVPGAVKRALERLTACKARDKLDRKQALAGDLLMDAAKLADAAHRLFESTTDQELTTAEAIEVIARKVLEHVIFLEHIVKSKDGDTLVDDFVKNFDAALHQLAKREPREAPPSWPKYEAMASSYPALYELYRRYSILSHPRSCIPYTYAVRRSGQPEAQYFRIRAQHALADLAAILHIGTDSTWLIGLVDEAQRRSKR